jgi:uncharacterized membrane protein HdeD (DUF308 family)
MKMDKNMTRNLSLVVTGVTGTLLVGVLPVVLPTINLLTPVVGAFNLGTLLGVSQLGVAYAIWKKMV